ncbi:MAG: SCO family protein [Acidimicrobiales bacterium]
MTMTKSATVLAPVAVSAFHAALMDQLLIIVGIGVVLFAVWNVYFVRYGRRARAAGGGAVAAAAAAAAADPDTAAAAAQGTGPGAVRAAALGASEPVGRRFLRIAFGLLWVLDGALQAQSAMPLGLPKEVVGPSTIGTPGWVHSLVYAGIRIWAYHPVTAAASVVWIQLGIGLALLLAPRGRWSRSAGLVSVGWALVVWIFGESFGRIFAPGLMWATGAPGAVIFYGVAGALIALPESSWRTTDGRRLGRIVTAVVGASFMGMALLQAWPGRGMWKGGTGSRAGGLEVWQITMAGMKDVPHFVSSWVVALAGFDAAHGWGVNLFLVVALAAIGVALVTGRRRAVLAATGAALVLCLAAWVLVQMFGFLGTGIGTDPNSMLPQLFLLCGGVLALLWSPAEAAEPAMIGAGAAAVAPWWRTLDALSPTVAARAMGALLAAGVVLVGVVPAAAASANSSANPLLTEAVNGTVDLVNHVAPAFTLTDQEGKSVSLKSLRGKAVALTFLDPVCSNGCPEIAQSFREADQMLGQQAEDTEFVAVVANPIYRSLAVTNAFDRREYLTGLKNWLYLTGSEKALRHVWDNYGIEVTVLPAGTMVGHSELAYVIDGQGNERAAFAADPGTTTTTGTGRASVASLSSLIDEELRSVISR